MVRMISTVAFVFLAPLAAAAADPVWHDNFPAAYKEARAQSKDVFVYFAADDKPHAALEAPEVKQKLKDYACCRVTTNYQYDGKRWLNHGCFREMRGCAGFAVVSCCDDKLKTHMEVISVHPFSGSRYRWAPAYGVEQVKIILDLPKTADLGQRSMIYAVSVHPERPRSILGRPHRRLLDHADRHSRRQAETLNQHHNMGACQSPEDASPSSEVVAESWGYRIGEDENILEGAFSCLDAWRHSSGHWGAVSREHKYYGYDLKRGADGRWFATGIFAD